MGKKELQCPKCHSKWHEDDIITWRDADISIRNLMWCPECFLSSGDKHYDKMTLRHRASCEMVPLVRSVRESTHVVVLDEFGDDLDAPIEQLKLLQIGDSAGPLLASEWTTDGDQESSGTCDYIIGQLAAA